MKIYLSTTNGNKIQIRTLDRRGARRLISYVDTPHYKKAEAARKRAEQSSGGDKQPSS